MNTDTQNAEAKPPQPDELQNLKDYLRENSLRLVVTAGIAIVVVIAVAVYRARKAESIVDAAQILNGAKTTKDIETVVEKHASTPYAPLAMLKLAKMHFNAGDYDKALTQYVEFRQKYPQHPMVDGAELDRIYCLEAMGRTEEALKGFADFSAQHPDHFLTAQAMFGQARCLEQTGRDQEAKTVYEDFIAAHPDSGWVSKAEELLALIVKKTKGGKDVSGTPATGTMETKEALAPVTATNQVK